MAKRYEWALRKGREYKRDVNDFIQLCTSCHHKYDGHVKNLPRPKLTAEIVREIRKEFTDRRGELTRLGKKYGVTYSNIRMIVDRKRWSNLC